MSDKTRKGELYKFIEDKEQSIEDYYGLTVYSEDMRKKLDEARADFPKLEAGSFHKNEDGTIEDYWAKDVMDWVKHWFGIGAP